MSSFPVPRVVLCLILLWVVVFTIACSFSGQAKNLLPGQDSVMDRFLGAGRVALSASFTETADDFFHRGVKHYQKKAFRNSIYQKFAFELKPEGHLHTEGGEVKEIMPWLKLSMQIDPHNVESYLSTSYWLAESVSRPDIAEQVMLEAQRNNPGDYRSYQERSRLAFQRGDDARATALLDAGLRRWPGGLDPKDRQAQIDLSQMLARRAFLYEFDGHQEQALEYFRKSARIMPELTGLQARIKALESGENTMQRDRKVWENVFFQRKACRREVHDGGEDRDHDSGAPEASEQDHGAPEG